MGLNPYDVQFGRRLARARQAAGLTLHQLAERLGWHVSTLHNYESGRRPLKIAQFVQLATALKRSPAALLAASDEAIPLIEQIEASAERREQVAIFLSHIEDPDGV
jgi:transcriptional regulator with XRE-family HTH domain